MFEHYIIQGDKRLRLGFTTGSAATLALKAALQELISGQLTHQVAITTPKGLVVEVEPEKQYTPDGISYGVRKDGGDDIDATDKALIVATIWPKPQGITIDGGLGVGRVTKPGLGLDIGSAAINRVPRQMMSALAEEMLGPDRGVQIVISVPDGERLAQRTFNPQLGIVGGISIIGTTGIVEPRSNQALIETIRLDLSVRREEGYRQIILTPGNLGEAYAKGLPETSRPIISYSNFLGETLDKVTELEFKEVFIVGHFGKLSKVAAGIMNTHSRQADGRREVVCAYSALAGVPVQTLKQVMTAATTDAMIDLIRDTGHLEEVLERILEAAQTQMERRLPHTKLHLLAFYTGGLVASPDFFEYWRRNES